MTTKRKLKVEEAPDDVLPICPHCRKELDTVWIKTKGLGILETKQVILCPHCRAFLGYGTI